MEILIVKLGALGDVLRTTPLLAGFHKKYPKSKITWVVDRPHRSVLEKNSEISKLISLQDLSDKKLSQLHFDLAVNLDKEKEALDVIGKAKADKKQGFGRDAKGSLCALDAMSDYAYRLGIDDRLKFVENKKSYQEISFEQVGLKFEAQEYLLNLDPKTLSQAKKHLMKLGVKFSGRRGPIIGLNTGSGKRFAGKKLPSKTYLDLIEKFSKELGATVLLLGGKDEIPLNRDLAKRSKVPVINTGSHPILFFAGIVKCCDVVISGDTTAMHVAIATKVPVVTYFASTCAAEIELYGRGAKIISEIECGPCYKRVCPIDEQCMKDMRVDEIFAATKKVLK